jgi:hypothetical protein
LTKVSRVYLAYKTKAKLYKCHGIIHLVAEALYK